MKISPTLVGKIYLLSKYNIAFLLSTAQKLYYAICTSFLGNATICTTDYKDGTSCLICNLCSGAVSKIQIFTIFFAWWCLVNILA